MAEVGSTFVTVIPSAKGFGKSLDAQVGSDVDKSGKTSGRRYGTALKVGALAVMGGAAVATRFLGSAISASSDLAENQSKVGVVFGRSAGQIMAASRTSATAMGLSESAYLGATGSLGNLLVSLDLAPKKAAGMSQQMVKLAGDMASFNNVPIEDALAAIQSGLTGETEPLKRFGVNMNDATLKAQALKMGLIKTTKDALTPQSKALAAQALIMAQTSTAQGDFARTSGGLANQQRILSAQFEDVKAKIGSALLPYITKAVTAVNGFVTGMQNGTGAGGRFAAAVTGLGSAISATVGFVRQHQTALTALLGVTAAVVAITQVHAAVMGVQAAGGLLKYLAATKLVTTATKVYAAVQWVLNAALSANPIGIVIVALVAIGAGLVLAYKKSETFRKIVDGAMKAVGAVFTWLWNNAFQPMVKFILTGLGTLMTAWGKLLQALGNVPGFGWAKTAGDAMERAGQKALEMADGIKKIPKDTKITVTTEYKTKGVMKGRNEAAGAYASGGPVTAGRTYLVGEKGPELFTSKQAGRIIPNHKLSTSSGARGSGSGAQITVYDRSGDPVRTAHETARQLAFAGGA